MNPATAKPSVDIGAPFPIFMLLQILKVGCFVIHNLPSNPSKHWVFAAILLASFLSVARWGCLMLRVKVEPGVQTLA
jgi:hypothetical protein